ncbi:hypothetical protein FACS189445_1210 [Spirochaetia bacterium]|nr:hypothetical protein FACS189445_1210 [Spirochaetia bacterium]
MTKELNGDKLLFAVFCIEYIAEYLQMDGGQVFELLTGKSDILDTYIIEYYDTLHTQGKDYIVNDIIELMQKEGLLK